MKNEQLVDLIFSANRIIREQAAGHGKNCLVSVVQMKILSFISDKTDPTMKEIADSLLITKPSATAAIERMVNAGQLKRINDKRDKRIVRLILTEKGRQIFNERKKEIIKRLGWIFEALDEKEKEEFANALSKIISAHKR